MRRSVWRGLLAFAAAGSIGLLTMATTGADASSAAFAGAAHRDAPACRTSGLDIWAAANHGSAYAGGYYDTIYLTNMSGHRCTLFGHAGVSAVGLNSKKIGSPAGWVGPAPKRVTLAQDATAAILVQVGDPANYAGGLPAVRHHPGAPRGRTAGLPAGPVHLQGGPASRPGLLPPRGSLDARGSRARSCDRPA